MRVILTLDATLHDASDLTRQAGAIVLFDAQSLASQVGLTEPVTPDLAMGLGLMLSERFGEMVPFQDDPMETQRWDGRDARFALDLGDLDAFDWEAVMEGFEQVCALYGNHAQGEAGKSSAAILAERANELLREPRAPRAQKSRVRKHI